MLIEFSVENYKSIKERQTLSMVADGGCIETGFNAARNLTEIAAIYGPNGSGKSKLVEAFALFRELVLSSHTLQPNQIIREKELVPFLFSKKTREEPIVFEAVFVHDGYLFQYGFSVDSKKVHSEWLYATPKTSEKQKTQTWLKREAQKFSSPAKKIQNSWDKETGENQLFFSVAANRQSEDFKKPFDWIQKKLKIVKNGIHPSFTEDQLLKGERKDSIVKFMKAFDFSFDDIEILEKELSEDEMNFPKNMPSEVKEQILNDFKGKKVRKVVAVHKTEEGSKYPLPFGEESLGTKALLAFSFPIIDVLENGYTLVVDELEKSLHPIALKGIISLFQNKETNPKNAQLIFTTHNTSTMSNLDREQIWLLDKGEFGDTFLTALLEYKDKPDAPLEKRYLGGRYGALPNIGDIL